MKLGLQLGYWQAQPPTNHVALAQEAERLGYDSVWTAEAWGSDAFTPLAWIGAQTSKIKLATGIVQISARTPASTAMHALTLDHLSHGRVILGLGSGTRSMNVNWYSMPFDDPPAPRMREATLLIRAAFAAQKGGGLKYEGKYYNVKIPQYARPGAAREKIPIYLAAVNKHMIRTAATCADGLIGHPIYTRKYIQEKVLPVLEDSACELAPYVITAISHDRDQARREARAQIAFYYTTRLYHTVLDVHGWRGVGETIADAFRRMDFQAMQEAVSDELLDAIALAGTPEDVRDQVAQWQGLSDHLLLYSPSVGMKPERVQENLTAIAETFAS